MIRHLLHYGIAIWIISAGAAGAAQNGGPIIRVLDTTGVEGIPGAVLLVNSGNRHNSRAFITDAHGRASLPHLSCDLCTVTALDPTGLFFSKTTEFDSRSPSITVTLQVRPTIDIVGSPGTINIAVAVYGPSGKPLSNQRVIVRPIVMTFDTDWAYRETTDSKGVVSAQLHPGQYTIATLVGGRPWEAPLRIEKKAGGGGLMAVHLAPVSTIPQ